MFLYILLALLIFGFLIFIHEGGHFIAARICGVTVNEFAEIYEELNAIAEEIEQCRLRNC